MFIEVSQVMHRTIQASVSRRNDSYRDTDEPGEGNPQPGDVTAEPTTPTSINLDNVCTITPRKDRAPGEPRTGCRIVFADGRAFAVTEPFDFFREAVSMAGFIELTKVVSMRRDRDDHDDEDGHVTSPEPGEEPTQACFTNPKAIRSFNRRKDTERGDHRLGCRVTFANARAFPVLQTYDVMLGLIHGGQNFGA